MLGNGLVCVYVREMCLVKIGSSYEFHDNVYCVPLYWPFTNDHNWCFLGSIRVNFLFFVYLNGLENENSIKRDSV